MPRICLRETPIIAIWSRPSLPILPGSRTGTELIASSNGRRLPSARLKIERQPESHIVHAESLAASRQDRRVASAWRRVRLVQHQSEWNVRFRAARFRGRLPAQDRRDESAAAKARKARTRRMIKGGVKWH